MRDLYLRDDLDAARRSGAFAGGDVFAALSTLPGEVYRRSARRSTSRVVIAEKAYFAKVHLGVGWGEIAKNLLSGKRPVLGARREFEASRRLRGRGVPVPGVAAFGERGFDPARRRSFVVCDALDGFRSLEDVGNSWLEAPPEAGVKRTLLTAVARLTAEMHGAGVCHRDYYACHLMANADKLGRGEVELAVIDLHRASVADRLSIRARVKDLGALLYSTAAMLGDRDRRRFVVAYAAASSNPELRRRRFWRAVSRRAERLHRRAAVAGVATGPHVLAGAQAASVGRLEDLDRNPPLPFRFDADLGSGGVRVVCTAVLRAQPGRRLVLRAVVDGCDLVLKAFFGRRAKRDWMREQDGAKTLGRCGVATPALLAVGRGAGARLVAYEAIEDAVPPSVGDVGNLLGVLARMHRQKVRQRDLHPDNFLVSQGQVFAIDGGGVAESTVLGDFRRLADIARLLAHYRSETLPPLGELATIYQNAAGAPLPERALRRLEARVATARRRRLARFVPKTGRECTAFVVREGSGRRVVVGRGDDDPQLEAIIDDPERAVAAGEPLKRGNTVTAVRAGGFVVKRYNVKDPWHRLRLGLRRTRARRAWRAGHGLRFAGLATPAPRALIEMHRPAVGDAVAYLVVDHVEGARLDAAADPEDVVPAVAGMFRAWRELRFVHGDTKASNFVVDGGEVHVLDLDAAAFRRRRWRFERRHRRDRVRFLANWQDVPASIRAAVGEGA